MGMYSLFTLVFKFALPSYTPAKQSPLPSPISPFPSSSTPSLPPPIINHPTDLSTLPIPLPPTLPPGEYLFRIEHIGLQTATDPTLGAQFFVSCAQIRVLPPINPQTTIQNHGVGGIPGPLVSIPGLYLPTDEDLKVNVYGVNETTYLNEPYMTRTPGPAIWKG
ncbi:putative endo-beta-1,4-glucanase D [Glarea lozoyensis 74030]|uniref:lytic cellulose monooxygenase (C4-dehydrogenating) n=1 Tax=Glarea lozoyensis (strain ATCC 74030 / MF5533) TaxID=1104152 RepID=H0EMN8_GLAL7|nr:putative endo-beta-1,4-glucanase D [Glarea lozoyensis 74030]